MVVFLITTIASIVISIIHVNATNNNGIVQKCIDELGLWPLPSNCSVDIYSNPTSLSSSFKIILSPSSEKILSPNEMDWMKNTIDRYNNILKPLYNNDNNVNNNNEKPLQELTINIATSISTTGNINSKKAQNIIWPSIKDDETYQLILNSKDDDESSNVNLFTNEIWGTIRGLETFSQLFNLNTKLSPYSTIRINDSPRFQYRGLMLDTSRHYVGMESIQALLDGMVYNKFNVLHWHITDDQSFPIQSTTFPNLAKNGSFDSTYQRHVYTPTNVDSILESARLRGIRVIPEFDMPGHSTSWFDGYPDLRTDCPDSSLKDFSKPMDVTKDSTYSFLQKLLTEMSNRFQDHYFHIGGDEVDGSCWEADPAVQQFCKEHNITSSPALQMYFEEKIVKQLIELGKIPIIWEENFGSLTGYPKGAIIEIWKHVWGNNTILEEIIRQGHEVIYTTPDWYLDYSTNAQKDKTPIPYTRRIDDSSEWKYYYQVDPFTNSTLNEKEQKQLLGAELCSWNVLFDSTNLLSNIFPRGVAVGERLWSDKSIRNETSAATRILNQRCRMVYRGIPVAPVAMADHCAFPYQFTYSGP